MCNTIYELPRRIFSFQIQFIIIVCFCGEGENWHRYLNFQYFFVSATFRLSFYACTNILYILNLCILNNLGSVLMFQITITHTLCFFFTNKNSTFCTYLSQWLSCLVAIENISTKMRFTRCKKYIFVSFNVRPRTAINFQVESYRHNGGGFS